MKWSLLPKQERGLEIAGFESIKAQLEIIEKAYTNDEMLAMFDDMNVTETSVSQYKRKIFKMFIPI
jgi:hypothetical protein